MNRVKMEWILDWIEKRIEDLNNRVRMMDRRNMLDRILIQSLDCRINELESFFQALVKEELDLMNRSMTDLVDRWESEKKGSYDPLLKNREKDHNLKSVV